VHHFSSTVGLVSRPLIDGACPLPHQLKSSQDLTVMDATKMPPSFKGMINTLFFTHNTMLSVLYSILISTNSHFLRSLDENGYLINKGAQFRYGLDSQYGDAVFVMKKDFWVTMKGSDHHGREITERAHVGHFYKRDFIEYLSDADRFLVERWMEVEAQNYDYRPETSQLNGKECKQSTWNVSWCNIQIHLGENVNFTHVEKVYVPAWLLHDDTKLEQISAGGVNMTLLRQFASNNLPYYPHSSDPNQPEVNLLNGKIHLYGPPRADDHYHLIEKEKGKFRHRTHSEVIYHPITPTAAPYTVQTHRHSASSSAISMSENAFWDLQIKYMSDLVRCNFTKKGSHEADQVLSYKLYE
jgi:hypothetical protein